LVELAKAPDSLGRLSDALAPGFGDRPSAPLIAGATVILYAGSGFFSGYLMTRTYLTDLLDAADRVRDTVARSVREASRAIQPDRDPAPTSAEFRPPLGGRIPPSHNREPTEEPLIIPGRLRDLVTPEDFRDLVVDLLRQLVGQETDVADDPLAMLNTLRRRGVLERKAYESLSRLMLWIPAGGSSSAPAWSATFTLTDDDRDLVIRLAELRKYANAYFESYVLETLTTNAPMQWTVQQDVELDPATGVRVDALVLDGRSQVVVEVRARLLTNDDEQLRALREWLDALAGDFPILLVLPGRRGAARHLSLGRLTRGRPVEILYWDDEASRLIPTVEQLLL
jgi:hypothetical protein